MTTTQITYHAPKTVKLDDVEKGWKIQFKNGDVGTVQYVRPGSVDLTVRTKRGAVKVQTLFISKRSHVEVIAS
jgi:hypothetical protein